MPIRSEKGQLLITSEAKRVIKQVSNELGMKEIILTSRIYLWFAQQDEVVKKGVLGLLPKGYESELVKLVLERLSRGGPGK